MPTPQPGKTKEVLPPEQAATREIGSRFGSRYRLLAKIGAGGMGAVYRVQDEVLDREVALKVLLPNLQAEAMIRFHQEAKATAKLNHKNILNVFDFGLSQSGEPFLVMDFIAGQSLADLLKANGPLEPSLAVPIFCQICSGLGYAHSLGILHRDIKPSNIMLVDDGRGFMQVKIVDFGLAKMSTEEQSLTTTGARVGSPLYMSPEQCNGLQVDQRSDIYSLGVLMYRTLTGSAPFQGDSFLDTLSKHVHEEPRDINENDRDLQFPAELSAVVTRALEKDPNKRFQSCDELRQALLALELAPEKVDSGGDSPSIPSPPRTIFNATNKRKYLVVALAATVSMLVFGAICKFVVGSFDEMNKQSVKEPLPEDHATLTEEYFRTSLIKYDEGKKHWLKAASSQFEDDSMSHLEHYSDVSRLNFTGTEITGSTLPVLLKLPVEELDLSSTYVDDKAMKTVGQIKTLQSLWLNGDRISDNGIKELKGLSKLRELGLRSTLITNDGLALLTSLPRLETLDLSNCSNLDAGALQSLQKMRSLTTLQIAGSHVPLQKLQEIATSAGINLILDKKLMHERPGWDHDFFHYRRRHDQDKWDYSKHNFFIDRRDPEFKRFFLNKKNWDLSDAEIKKIKNPRIRAYLDDPAMRKQMQNPEIRKKYQNPAAWQEHAEMEDMWSSVIIGPDSFSSKEQIEKTRPQQTMPNDFPETDTSK